MSYEYSEWQANNQDRVREYKRRYKRRNREKIRTHKAIERALSSGKILRPKRCNECGRERKLEAHHHDYDQPLAVLWLCKPCHMDLHRGRKNRAPANYDAPPEPGGGDA